MDTCDRRSLQSSQAGEGGEGVDDLRRQQVEQPVERHGGDITSGVDPGAVAQFQPPHSAVTNVDRADGVVEQDTDAALLKPALKFTAVQAVKWDGRQFDFKAARMAHKAIYEDLASVTEADAVARFVQGAGEDDAPKAVDDARGLAVALKPIEEGRIGVGRSESQPKEPPNHAVFFNKR